MSGDPDKTPAIILPEHDPRRVVPLGFRVVASPDSAAVDRVQLVVATLVIGRSDADFSIADAGMSRRHCAFEVREGALGIIDFGSTNGTFLDGVRLTKDIYTTVHAGSVVRISDSLLVVVDTTNECRKTPKPPWASGFVGESDGVWRLIDELGALSSSRVPVLIHGETGAGKDVAARALHRASGAKGAFVALNCGSVPESLAESALFGHVRGAFTGAEMDVKGAWVQADGGSLFLDEIAELPPQMQAKLLRAADTGEVRPIGSEAPILVRARLVSATNVDLEAAVSSGRFRRDLFMRLAAYTLRIPSLRERRSDIVQLLKAALSEHGSEARLTARALERVLLSELKGNVRELNNLAARLALYPDLMLDERHLPDAFFPTDSRPPAAPLRPTPPAASNAQIPPNLEALIAQFEGNVSALAAHLGRDRRQVYRWLEHLQIDPAKFRG